MGWRTPSFMAVSMASTPPVPSCRAKAASLSMGTTMRLTMKPGESLAGTGVLPIRRTTASAARQVSSPVAMPRISSTSCITGTGFMKWMPMKRSGRGA